MSQQFDARLHIQELLKKGWLWSSANSDVLMHPEDHSLRLRYNRTSNTISISPELEKALDLVIPTPASKSRTLRR